MNLSGLRITNVSAKYIVEGISLYIQYIIHSTYFIVHIPIQIETQIQIHSTYTSPPASISSRYYLFIIYATSSCYISITAITICIVAFPLLENLTLNLTKFGDEGIVTLSSSPTFQQSLRRLSLVSTPVTSSSIRSLKGKNQPKTNESIELIICNSLVILISNDMITKFYIYISLIHIGFHGLVYLNIWATQITSTGLERLQEELSHVPSTSLVKVNSLFEIGRYMLFPFLSDILISFYISCWSF